MAWLCEKEQEGSLQYFSGVGCRDRLASLLWAMATSHLLERLVRSHSGEESLEQLDLINTCASARNFGAWVQGEKVWSGHTCGV
eukprot:70088-Amphidinium_carterae.1